MSKENVGSGEIHPADDKEEGNSPTQRQTDDTRHEATQDEQTETREGEDPSTVDDAPDEGDWGFGSLASLNSEQNTTEDVLEYLAANIRAESGRRPIEEQVHLLTGPPFPSTVYSTRVVEYGNMCQAWAQRRYLNEGAIDKRLDFYVNYIDTKIGVDSQSVPIQKAIVEIIEYCAKVNKKERTLAEIFVIVYVFVWRMRKNGYPLLGCLLVMHAFGMLNWGGSIVKAKPWSMVNYPRKLGRNFHKLRNDHNGWSNMCTRQPGNNFYEFNALIDHCRKVAGELESKKFSKPPPPVVSGARDGRRVSISDEVATYVLNDSSTGHSTALDESETGQSTAQSTTAVDLSKLNVSAIQVPKGQLVSGAPLKSALKQSGILASTRLDTSGLTDLTSKIAPRGDLVQDAITKLFAGGDITAKEETALHQYWCQVFDRKTADKIIREVELVRTYLPGPAQADDRGKEIKTRVLAISREASTDKTQRARDAHDEEYHSFEDRLDIWPTSDIDSPQHAIDFAVRLVDCGVPRNQRMAKMKDILGLLSNSPRLTWEQRRFASEALFELPNDTIYNTAPTATSMYSIDNSNAFVPFPVLGLAAHPSDRAIKQLRNAGMHSFDLHKSDVYTKAYLDQIASACTTYNWGPSALYECLKVLASADTREYYLLWMQGQSKDVPLRTSIEKLWMHIQTYSSGRVDFEGLRRKVNDIIERPTSGFGRSMREIYRLRTMMRRDDTDMNADSAFNDAIQDGKTWIHRHHSRDYNLVISSWTDHCRRANILSCGSDGLDALISVVHKLIGESAPRPNPQRDPRIPVVTGLRPKARVAAVDVGTHDETDPLGAAGFTLAEEEVTEQDSISQTGSRASSRSSITRSFMNTVLTRLNEIDRDHKMLTADVAYIRGNKVTSGEPDVTKFVPKNPENCRLCNEPHRWRQCPNFVNPTATYFRSDGTQCTLCGGCHRTFKDGPACWKLRGKTQAK